MDYTNIESLLRQIRDESSYAGNTKERVYNALHAILDYSEKVKGLIMPPSRNYVGIKNGKLALDLRTETVIESELNAGDNIIVVCPAAADGKISWAILIFTTGTTIPSITLPANIVWRGEKAPKLEANTVYRILFNIYKENVLANTF